MHKVFSHESIVTITHLHNLLQAEGIAAQVRNDGLTGVVGEVPFMECWPQLWVADSRDIHRAEALIRDAMADPPGDQPPWTCRGCGEAVDGHFAACWNCGAEDRA